MREATYQDAIAVGQLLNIHRDEVWKVLKGVRYRTESELWMAVHNAFRVPAPATQGADVPGEEISPVIGP